MRSLSATLIAAQVNNVPGSVGKATPYIELFFFNGITSYTYTLADGEQYIKSIRHSEIPYSGTATIVFRNNNQQGEDSPIPDLLGYCCLIRYGYVTAAGNERKTCAPLWVIVQEWSSVPGNTDNILTLADAWWILNNRFDIAELLAATPPYYTIDYAGTDYTIYDIIKAYIEAAGYTLSALGTQSDGIIDVLKPEFVANNSEIDSALQTLYRLINMTMCFVRAEAVEPSAGSGFVYKGTYYGTSRRLVYGAGLWWLFADANDTVLGPDMIVYQTSETMASSVSWSASTTIATNAYSVSAVVASDGVTVHLCWWVPGIGVKYQMGTLETDGSITMIGSPTVIDAVGRHPVIALDSNDYPWIGYEQAYNTYVGYFYIAASSTKDGTWTNVAGFPHKLTGNGTGYKTSPCVVPVMLTAGKMAIVYAYADTPNLIKVKWWDGAAWGTDENASQLSALPSLYNWSAIALGDELYVVYPLNPGIVCRHSPYPGSAWSSAGDTIDTYIGGGSMVLCHNGSTLKLFASDAGGAIYTLDYIVATGVWTGREFYKQDMWLYAIGLGAAIDYPEVYWSTYQIDPIQVKVNGISLSIDGASTLPSCNFVIVYPRSYTGYHQTYLSDKPTAASYQFKEFEWQDHERVPHHVITIGNEVIDENGDWDAGALMKGNYWLVGSAGLPEFVQYHLAATLRTQTDLDNRAKSIAVRQHMEDTLGRILVQHDCSVELYDWVQVQDMRGRVSYLTYPKGNWAQDCVVGALTHVYEAAKGVYTLEIFLNGLNSELPVVSTTPGKITPVTPITQTQPITEGIIWGTPGGGNQSSESMTPEQVLASPFVNPTPTPTPALPISPPPISDWSVMSFEEWKKANPHLVYGKPLSVVRKLYDDYVKSKR